MRKGVFIGIGLLAIVCTMAGCDNSLKEENALLLEENQGLRAQLEERNSALTAANEELRNKDLALAGLRRDLQSAQAAPPSRPASTDPFAGIPGVTGSVGAGEVTATVESDVLFDSGKATLKASAKKSLDAVASVLRSRYDGRTIRVEGFTDTDPIKKSGFKSNHHLGFERAYAVREYLVSQGVPAASVYLASHGPDQPKGTKSESRRVEIAVILDN